MKRQQDSRRGRQFEQRIERQRAEARRARDGRTAAASAVRRLDPVTGEVIEVLAGARARFTLPKAVKGEAEAGDLRALRVLARAGRCGAPASWLAELALEGEAKALSLLRRGLVKATRGNQFVLMKWTDKAVPPPINWDEAKSPDARRVGMVEPH